MSTRIINTGKERLGITLRLRTEAGPDIKSSVVAIRQIGTGVVTKPPKILRITEKGDETLENVVHGVEPIFPDYGSIDKSDRRRHRRKLTESREDRMISQTNDGLGTMERTGRVVGEK